MNKTEKNYKIAGILFIIATVTFILSEFICAIYTKVSLIETYALHTISELGVPYQINHFTPVYDLMNYAFIIVGILLLIGSILAVGKMIEKHNLLYYLFVLITSIGMIIIAFYHAGHPYHAIGALMALVGGNLMLITISQSIKASKNYRIITLILGFIGLISAFGMIYFMTVPELYIFKAIPERICVYSLLIWSLISGLYLVKK